MKSILKYSFFIVSTLGLLLFSQCRKSDRNTEVINPAPQENAIANVVFNDIFRVVHSVSVGDTLMNGQISAGNLIDVCIDAVNYAYIQENFPNTMVLNFGNDQSACSMDGRVRNGKLRLDFSGKYSSNSTSINVEFIGYYVDSMKVNGTVTIRNKGLNTNNEPTFNMLIADASIERDSLDISWSGTRNYVMKQGSSTVSTSDDQFEISGSSSGITSKGNSYEADIIDVLISTFSCDWFSSGTEEVQPENIIARDVDYGTNCSSSVKVSYYGKEQHSFTLE